MNALVLDMKPFPENAPDHGDICLCYNPVAEDKDFLYVIGKYNKYLRRFHRPIFWCDNGNCQDHNGAYINITKFSFLKRGNLKSEMYGH